MPLLILSQSLAVLSKILNRHMINPILYLSNGGRSYFSVMDIKIDLPLQIPFCGGRVKGTQVANRESSCTGP